MQGHDKRIIISIIVLIIAALFGTSIGWALIAQYEAKTGANKDPNLEVSDVSYIIYKDDTGMSCAKNGTTGIIDKTSSNDTSVIQFSIDQTSSGTILIEEGIYNITCTLMTLYFNTYYVGLNIEHKKIHLHGTGTGETVLRLADGQNDINRSCLILYARWYDNFAITDITFDGNKDRQPNSSYYADGAGLILTGGIRSHGLFQNLTLKNSCGNGIYLGNNHGGWENGSIIDNIHSSNNNQAGIMFDSMQNCEVTKLSSHDDGLLESSRGVQFYGNGNWQRRNDNVTVSGIELTNATIRMVYVNGITVTGIEIHNNNSYLTNSAGSIHITNSMNVSLQVDLLDREVTKGYGVYCFNSKNINIYPTFIHAAECIYIGYDSNVNIFNGSLKSSFSGITSDQSGVVYATGCMIQSDQYSFRVLGNSTMELIDIQCIGGVVPFVSPTGHLSIKDSIADNVISDTRY